MQQMIIMTMWGYILKRCSLFWMYLVMMMFIIIIEDVQFGMCQAGGGSRKSVNCEAPRMTIANMGTTQYGVNLIVVRSKEDQPPPPPPDSTCLCQSVIASADGSGGIEGYRLTIGACQLNTEEGCPNHDRPAWKCDCPFKKSLFGQCTCYDAEGAAGAEGCTLGEPEETVWPLYPDPDDASQRYLLQEDRQVCWPICEAHLTVTASGTDCPFDRGCFVSIWRWCVCGQPAGSSPEMCKCDPVSIPDVGSAGNVSQCDVYPDKLACLRNRTIIPTTTNPDTGFSFMPTQNTDIPARMPLTVPLYIAIGAGSLVLVIIVVVNIVICYCCWLRSRNKTPDTAMTTEYTERKNSDFSTSFVYARGPNSKPITATSEDDKPALPAARVSAAHVYTDIKPHEHGGGDKENPPSPSNLYEINVQSHQQSEPKLSGDPHDYVVLNSDTVDPYEPVDDTETEPDYFQLERIESLRTEPDSQPDGDGGNGYGQLNLGLEVNTAYQYDMLDRGLSVVVSEEKEGAVADTGQYEDAYNHLS